LTEQRARQIGMRGRERVLKEHTYNQRAAVVDALFRQCLARRRQARAA
jgi:hypothetical protein